jgi:hypothetical protein
MIEREPMFDQHPDGADVQHCTPDITARAATAAEVAGLRPWLVLQGLGVQAADVVVFADGNTRHAPETVVAYHTLTKGLPAGFGLLYLHCGVQALCLDPLLPSLLFLTGHVGPVHALRRGRDATASQGLSPAETEFLQAMTPPGGCTLVIDDLQLRIAAPGMARAAPVTLSLFRRAMTALQPKEHPVHDHD